MSAGLVVDLFGSAQMVPSVIVGSGSDLLVGNIVDLAACGDEATNIFVAAGIGGSGAIEVRVQCSDSTTSGTFTDPTSGKPTSAFFANGVLSGGILIANSGLWNSGYNQPCAPINNAPMFCSGGVYGAMFQRGQRYARLLYVSGPFPGAIIAGFAEQKLVTGSGPGYATSPQSGGIPATV